MTQINHSKYIVELIGFNDGHPYPEFKSNDFEEAKEKLNQLRTEKPRVAFRLIQIIEEHEALDD